MLRLSNYVAITVKVAGPTDHAGTRLIVSDGTRRKVVPYPSYLSIDDAFLYAVSQFLKDEDDRTAQSNWIGAYTKDGMVFVNTEKE